MPRGNIVWVKPSADSISESVAASDVIGATSAPNDLIVSASTPMPHHDPPLSPRDEAIFLLHTAAEVEHALMVQYLYAAFSLKPDALASWFTSIFQTAKEEMGHLLTVQNILRLLGGPLNFDREDFPFRSDFYPFHFKLEPLSEASLAKYIVAEMPENAEISPEVRQRIEDLTGGGTNRVGALYSRVIDLVASLQPHDFRTDTEPWQAVPEEWHTAPLNLVRDANNQITFVPPGVMVMPTRTKAEALDALRAIALQGEGASVNSGTNPESHFARFLAVFTDPAFNNDQALPVPTGSDDSAALITDEHSKKWSQLADIRYRRLLTSMLHALHLQKGDKNSDRSLLVNWTFEEMYRLAPLMRFLRTLPQDTGVGVETAAAAVLFQLPYTLAIADREIDRWRAQNSILESARLIVAEIRKKPVSATGEDILKLMKEQDDASREVLRSRTGDPADLPIDDILEIRLLPALAIGRFGSSPDPMDNYNLNQELTANTQPGFRPMVPAETLVVDRSTGQITQKYTPTTIRFRDGDGNIRPVAPFFEVWARFTEAGTWQPLTVRHLEALNLTPAALRWSVRAGNHKAFRRTGDPGDRIDAATGTFSDHAVKALTGRADNFKAGKTIPFGSMQYLQPTDTFPEIRLRFTPSTGKVYGPTAGDPNTVADVYDATKGNWLGHEDGTPGRPIVTQPGGIFAVSHAPGSNGSSLGYLDDACDGIVEVRLTINGREQSSSARFVSGPPDFAPDCLPVRSVADELEQLLQGPVVTSDVTVEEVIDILRRALDTVHQMNTEAMNRNGMSGHDSRSGRAREPIFQPETRALNAQVRNFHAVRLQMLTGLKEGASPDERQAAIETLQRILDLLRTYDTVGDLTNAGRQRMPAMMRGADAMHLALTRRQRDKVRRAIEQFKLTPQEPVPQTPGEAMRSLIVSLQGNSGFHFGVPVGDGRNLSVLFDTPDELMSYLRTNSAKQPSSGTLVGKPLIVPGNPAESSFFQLITGINPVMTSQFSLNDPTAGKKRSDIVKEWIESLTP